MSHILIVGLGLWLLVPLVTQAADFDETKYSATERQAAAMLARERTNPFEMEAFTKKYQAILRESDCGCGQQPTRAEELHGTRQGLLQTQNGFDIKDVFNDDTWIENNQKLRATDSAKIFFGREAKPDEFPATVCIDTGCCRCTGTLVSKNVVVTAKHCLLDPNNNSTKIRSVSFGLECNTGETIRVIEQIPHSDLDIAVLILEQNASVTPRKIATTEQVLKATSVRVVGFGVTELGERDKQMVADVAMASSNCTRFGCKQGEFVAAGGESDTCNGDSGGPAFVMVGDELLLGGATSRAIGGGGSTMINGRRYFCGSGGIYGIVAEAFKDPSFVSRITAAGGNLSGNETPPPTDVTLPEKPLKPAVKQAMEGLKKAIENLEKALTSAA